MIPNNEVPEDMLSRCPLCGSSGPFRPLTSPIHLAYSLCETCQLIFIERSILPDRVAEEERYKTHKNGPQYPGYVNFLYQAITPTLPYLNSSMQGLDYGCGPVPTLSGLLRNEGLHCEDYDPLFFPDLPDRKFDFIFANEVVEHFFYPGKELARITDRLNPSGIFTMMTELWHGLENFSEWYYAKDFTHVAFFHTRTIDFICGRYGFRILNQENARVTILEKQ
jgi:SAM-dependent methyltransferase